MVTRPLTPVQSRRKRRRRLLSILLAVAAMALADVLGRLVVAAPVLLIPTLLLAGCVLAVADETRGDARAGRVR